MTQQINADQCRIMHKEEWVNTLLIEVTSNPKITNNELAEKYGVHRNRISRYRKIIRQRQLRSNNEIVNKIDNVLEDRLIDMEDRDLINYRKAVAPTEIKVDQTYKEIKLEWKLDTNPNVVKE
jgi:hypothetical protein